MPLEVLHRAFMFFGLFHGMECPQIAALAGFGGSSCANKDDMAGFQFTDQMEFGWLWGANYGYPPRGMAVRFRTHFPTNDHSTFKCHEYNLAKLLYSADVKDFQNGRDVAYILLTARYNARH
jgi:hypothetical protein